MNQSFNGWNNKPIHPNVNQSMLSINHHHDSWQTYCVDRKNRHDFLLFHHRNNPYHHHCYDCHEWHRSTSGARPDLHSSSAGWDQSQFGHGQPPALAVLIWHGEGVWPSIGGRPELKKKKVNECGKEGEKRM